MTGILEEAPSQENLRAEVQSYTGLDLTVGEIQSLYSILKVPRSDSAIRSHLRRAHHRLGDLPYLLPVGKNWYAKVATAMWEAVDNPCIKEKAGTREDRIAHDRDAVIFWLEQRILPTLTEGDTVSGASNETSKAEEENQPGGAVKPSLGKTGNSGPGPLADAKKRRALENYAMDAAKAYYELRGWVVEPVSHKKMALDLLLHSTSGKERRVEVKGSSSKSADYVLVTSGEVSISRGEDCDLFVVDGIEYEDLGPDPDAYKCKSGRERAGTWYADEDDLTPKTYQYCLGADFGQV